MMDISNIFKNCKHIINYFDFIFKNIVLSKDEKSILLNFLHNKLINIYKIINKKKDFIIKLDIPLDEHFFKIFHNIINKKQEGGLNLLINNRNLLNYIIDTKKNNNINKEVITFYENICTFLILISKKTEIEFIDNIIIDLENNKEIDKELILYCKLLLKKKYI